MAAQPPIPLTPRMLRLSDDAATVFTDADYLVVAGWPYADAFVSRLLREDVPRRMLINQCELYVYRDPDERLVGFGTIEACSEYSDYLDGREHLYLPLLAVNPTIKSLGFGSSILSHLIDTAIALKAGADRASEGRNLLVLDVYTTSVKAIALYERFGFERLIPDPLRDPAENDSPYWVMARAV